jgi:hypothetical protein
MTNTLDILDAWNETEDRALDIYEDIIRACGIKSPPLLMLSQLDQIPISEGMAACYVNTHEIFMDFEWTNQATDAEIAGCLAHELAHGFAGIHEGHGRAFKAVEREIIDLMRCYGMVVEPAPDQTRLSAPALARTQSKFWIRVRALLHGSI